MSYTRTTVYVSIILIGAIIGLEVFQQYIIANFGETLTEERLMRELDELLDSDIDPRFAHQQADTLLLEYIGVDSVTEVFNRLPKVSEPRP